MQRENSIKETVSNVAEEPITDYKKVLEIIAEWNGISFADLLSKSGNPSIIGTDSKWIPIFAREWYIIDPLREYLRATYDWKEIVFEKWDEKYFGTMHIAYGVDYSYQLWDKCITIPYRLYAKNEDWTSMTIFPKSSDILQPRMKGLYIVNTWRAERQRLEKEIMSKLVELAMVRWWNEILSSQDGLAWIKASLAKRWIEVVLDAGYIFLNIPWRMIRDTAGEDGDYPAPPITLKINFENKHITCLWYSSHWFGSPTERWNPCWWNADRNVSSLLRDCDLQWLVNLLVQRAYWYNSRDTWTSQDWRHPVWKLRQYLNHYSDRDIPEKEQQWLKDMVDEIKKWETIPSRILSSLWIDNGEDETTE